MADSFNGSNLHEFLHLDTDPMSPCVDRGYTPRWQDDEGTWHAIRYRDADDSVGPRDMNPLFNIGDPAIFDDPYYINDERDIGADEAPTPPLDAFDFWFEQR